MILVHPLYGKEFIMYPSVHPCLGVFEQSMQSLSGLSPCPLSSRHLLGSCFGAVQVIFVHPLCGEEFMIYPSAHPCFGGFKQSTQSLSGLSPCPLSSRHLLGSCKAINVNRKKMSNCFDIIINNYLNTQITYKRSCHLPVRR